jgi:hypothetical protein
VVVIPDTDAYVPPSSNSLQGGPILDFVNMHQF